MGKNLKVAVMGGGNSAHTMAADIALGGLEVNLCDLPVFQRNIQEVMETRRIEKVGSAATRGKTGIAELNKATTDIPDAVKNVDVVMLAIPAYGHMEFFQSLLGSLEEGQIVIVLPGNWGAIRLFNFLRSMGFKKRVFIGETDRCMHICRASESWLGPGKARVILERPVVRLSAMPASDTPAVFHPMKTIYPQLVPAHHVVETSLNNFNPIIHGPLVLMNAGWIEHTAGQFMIYRDGATPAIGSVVDAIADERDAVLQKFGLATDMREPFYDLVKNAEWCKDPCETGPPNLQHRYLTEDIPYGLVPLAYLGDVVGVPTPMSDALVELASKVNHVNYWKDGLTLERLGFAGLRHEEIIELVMNGD
jgi:opine dehydrogenase